MLWDTYSPQHLLYMAAPRPIIDAKSDAWICILSTSPKFQIKSPNQSFFRGASAVQIYLSSLHMYMASLRSTQKLESTAVDRELKYPRPLVHWSSFSPSCS